MRSRGTNPRRAVAPVAPAPWSTTRVPDLLASTLLACALLAPVAAVAPAVAQTAIDGSPLPGTGAPPTGTAPIGLRPTLGDQPLRSTTVAPTAPGSNADDGRTFAKPGATAVSDPAPDIGGDGSDVGASGTLIRIGGPTAARRPPANNQARDTTDTSLDGTAPDATDTVPDAGTTVRPPAPTRTGSIGRVTPVTAATPRTDAGPRTPQAATQPNPRDTRAAQREEPETPDDGYTALGLRTGSFTWFPALELSAGGSTNVNGKASALAGSVFTAAPELTGRSDWSRHELQVEMRGSYAVIPVNHDYDKPAGQIALRGRIDLTDEMRMDVRGGWSYERQSNSSTDNPAATGVASNLQTRTASLGLTRDVGLVALTLRGDVERTDYSGGTDVTGAPLGSEVQNNTRLIGAFRATLGSAGVLRPFVELQTTHRDYDQNLIAGSRRDSDGAAVKTGVVADLGPTLRGEMSTGWGNERPDDATLATMSGWLLDGTLAWSPTRLTVIRVTAKTDFLPTTLAGSPGAVSRTFGATVEQSLRRNLTANVGAALTARSFVGVDQNDRDLILSTGLTYKIDRRFQTFVRGSWEKFNTNIPGSDYSTAVVMVGVRVQQ